MSERHAEKPDPWAEELHRRLREYESDGMPHDEARKKVTEEMELTHEQAQRAIDAWRVSN